MTPAINRAVSEGVPVFTFCCDVTNSEGFKEEWEKVGPENVSLLPFIQVKEDSAVGAHEQGQTAAEFYTEVQTVHVLPAIA